MHNEAHKPSIDITTLAWESPAPSRDTKAFDPEVDITNDWDEILNQYNREKEKMVRMLQEWPSWERQDSDRAFAGQIASIAATVRLFAPARVRELDLPELQPIIKNMLENHQGHPPDEPCLYYLKSSFLTTAFASESPQLGINESDSTRLKSLIKRYGAANTWHIAARAALTFYTFFPHRINELGLDEERITQRTLEEIKEDKKRGDWLELARNAATLKALFPKKTDAINEELDRITWQQLIQSVHALDSVTILFCEYALDIAILAAKKVEITDHGIELLFDRSEPFTQPTPPPPPPVRKF